MLIKLPNRVIQTDPDVQVCVTNGKIHSETKNLKGYFLPFPMLEPDRAQFKKELVDLQIDIQDMLEKIPTSISLILELGNNNVHLWINQAFENLDNLKMTRNRRPPVRLQMAPILRSEAHSGPKTPRNTNWFKSSNGKCSRDIPMSLGPI